MKRENSCSEDDYNGGGRGNGGGGASNKRFRGDNEDEVRLLIPSRIAGAIIGKGGQHINRLRSQYKSVINVEDCLGPERTVNISADFNSSISIIEEMLKNFDEKDDEYDIRLLIHQSLAGCIIGKAGSKIKEIRDKIGCRILKVFSNVCPQSSDRVVQCVGKAEQCLDALREVLDLIKEVPVKGRVQNYDPINYDDQFADKYGGYGDNNGGNGQNGGGRGGNGGSFRGGDNGGRFGGNGRGGDDRGGFGGNRGDGGRGSGRQNDRRDNNGGGNNRNMRDRDFIDPWASNQGPMVGNGNNFGGGNGFGNNSFGGGNNGFGGSNGNVGNMGGNNGGGFGGNNGGNMNAIGGFGGGNIGGGGTGNFGGSNNLPSLGNLGGGNLSANNLGTGNGGNFGGNSGGNNGSNDDTKSTTQVTIPKDLAGAIIGKAGGRIRRIRMESNAFITIDEPLAGSTDRIITITGSSQEIQMAQYLLQQSVHEHRQQF